MNQISKPNLLEYFEYAEYLRDFYTWSKENNRAFSYQSWAKSAGLASKGYLRMVVMGKRRLTDETFKKLLPTLNLNVSQQEVFKILVDLGRANNLTEKTKVYEKLVQAKGLKKIKDVDNSYEYLSDEWLPRLHVLLGIKNISRTEKDLSKSLGISLGDLRILCKKLEKLGYARKHDNQWEANNEITFMSNKINNIAVQRFHKNSLETSISALDLDSNERHFNAIYYALDRESYEIVAKKIDSFSKELLLEFSQKEINDDKKLYQINTNLIPMSENLIRSNERAIELIEN